MCKGKVKIWIKCPIANHGNIAMCKGETTSIVAATKME
jgi:hypothetical protein